jgi:hypothetical protein
MVQVQPGQKLSRPCIKKKKKKMWVVVLAFGPSYFGGGDKRMVT